MSDAIDAKAAIAAGWGNSVKVETLEGVVHSHMFHIYRSK